MKNTRWILCFDFETDLPDPENCNPTQLAAVPIDPESLETMTDQIFNVNIRPIGIDSPDYFTPEREKTINWTAEKLGMNYDDVIKMWKDGMCQKVAWKNFCAYCSKYHVQKRKGMWYPEPIPAGYNIITFDIPIAKRMCKDHKTKLPFSEVNKLDIFDMIFWWFESLSEPEDFKMDTLRDFLGMKAKGKAHDAAIDILDESDILVRYMRFHRKQTSVAKFKGSFA